MAGAGHGNHPADVFAIVEFGGDLVTWVAGAPEAFFRSIPGQGIATLDHEPVDDPVKGRAVVEALADKLAEVGDGFGGNILPKGDSEGSLVRFE